MKPQPLFLREDTPTCSFHLQQKRFSHSGASNIVFYLATLNSSKCRRCNEVRFIWAVEALGVVSYACTIVHSVDVEPILWNFSMALSNVRSRSRAPSMDCASRLLRPATVVLTAAPAVPAARVANSAPRTGRNMIPAPKMMISGIQYIKSEKPCKE